MKGGRSIKLIFVHLLTGNVTGQNVAMRFQVILIIVTGIIAAIFLILPPKWRTFSVLILGIGASIACLFGANKELFANSPDSIRNSYGRLLTMIPYACLGIVFVKYRVIDYIKAHQKIWIPILVLLFGPIQFFGILNSWTDSSYFGIKAVILTLAYFMSCSMIPNTMFPSCIRKIFGFVARYTMGIYCSHFLCKDS